MARYDLHRRKDAPGYLLNLQDAFLDELPTRIACPVLPLSGPLPSFRDLAPVVEIEGKPHIVFPQYLGAVEKRVLGRAVGSLETHRDAITKALDMLFTGF